MSVQNPTFGEFQFQCQKRHSGLDPDILQSFINERLRRIARRIPWQQTKIQDAISTVAQYTSGTVAATLGGDGIEGTATVWTSDMDGCSIRIGNDSAYYEFIYSAPGAGFLDRDYEGATNLLATYSIWRNIFPLPADCREFLGMRCPGRSRPLDRVSMEELDAIDPNRVSTGNPLRYAPHMDDRSSPKKQQVEVHPVPIEVMALPYWYLQDPAMFDVADTDGYIPSWVNPDVLYAGVTADALFKEKDYAGADRAEAAYLRGANEMLAAECAKMPAAQIRMADRFARHRELRGVARSFPFQLP
ncbi:MAG: hypothetical protein V1790_17585 [Planctomycetota bacterium]